MENLIYSLNATVPVFLVIVLGYVLKRIGMLNEEFVRVANKFNFTVTHPALLFRDLSTANITEMFDGGYVLFCASVTTVSFAAVWYIAKRVLKDKSMVGAFVQASFRSSAAVLGIAFIQNIYGNSGMAPLMIIGTVPLYNIYSVIVLTFEAQEDAASEEVDRKVLDGAGEVAREASKQRDTSKIKKAFRNILTNPIILAIAAGVAVSLIQVDFPVFVDKTVSSLASMASPLALIAIGAGFEGRKALAKMKPSLAATFLKLVGFAAIFLPIAVMLGFREEKLMALIVMLASPTTPSCYIMAKNMKNDGTLTSSIVVLTTMLSAFTLTLWIYIMRSIGVL
ncbi:MAG: AEC family transporter [Lachnospiraceae bacterium]|nr:AEC family transporter [Lachnospiraceae bacterium]